MADASPPAAAKLDTTFSAKVTMERPEGPLVEPPLPDAEARIDWLRERGVTVELAEDLLKPKVAKAPPAAEPGGEPRDTFGFVRIPADSNEPVAPLTAEADATCDVLQALLAPFFADDAAMDADTVTRETASRLKGMVLGGQCGALKAPSATEIHRLARGGACEAYPLSRASEDNDERVVRLYIDEVGALRARPRNRRAEELAEAAGLAGLSIHGDAFVGRCARNRYGMGVESNVDFPVSDLARDAAWVREACKDHTESAQRAGHGATEHLASGAEAGDADGRGAYTWTQTDDDVEVRVAGAPEGRGAAKRVDVAYGRGDTLVVKIDKEAVLCVAKLFDRVTPDDCAWTLDKGTVVVTLEKAQPRAWASLHLPSVEVPAGMSASFVE